MSSHPVSRGAWLALAGFCLTAAVPTDAQTNAAPRPWTDYHTILWIGDSVWKQPAKLPQFFDRLREMGVNTAMVFGDNDPQPFLDNHFPYYVENLVNRGLCLKFSSKVTDWDKFVTEWARGGRPESALVRDYCLDDAGWRDWARKETQRIARRNGPHQPLAYNLRDELSTTLSANPFDYDFSPASLAGFRQWLRTQYRDLAALNEEWETRFATWDEVRPFTTDRIKNRMASGDAAPRGGVDWQALQGLHFDVAEARKTPTRWNFAPWADFRSYTDLSLARALGSLREAAREADPATPVGIEGTQMPNTFGGYDLWRLSQVLDWVEPYDIGSAREIFGSFMAGKPMVTTVFESDTAHARRRLWHLLLEGDRGCIVWWSEDCLDWKSPDYALTPKARALAPALREMTSPLARLFIAAERETDPVYLHYSQTSIQADWLLESTVDGSTWLRRFSSFEAEHNRMAAVREAWLRLVEDAGWSPRFVSSEELEGGRLARLPRGALVLPTSLALSEGEAAAIRKFHADGGVVLADGTPGLFDGHGRLRRTGALEPLFPAAAETVTRRAGGTPAAAGAVGHYGADRLRAAPDPAWPRWVAEQLGALKPEISVPAGARVRVHRYRLGNVRLAAFERNVDYHMSEDLKQAGGNEALEKPVEVHAVLAHPAVVYDLRSGRSLGRLERLDFTLDPWAPSLFALADEALPAGEVVEVLTARAKAGPAR